MGICMALLLADCKGSGKQMKYSKLTTRFIFMIVGDVHNEMS